MAASQELRGHRIKRGRQLFAPTNRKLMAKNNRSEPSKKKNLPKFVFRWFCADLPVRRDNSRRKKLAESEF